jgi:Flp pilus assembly protein CpaB
MVEELTRAPVQQPATLLSRVRWSRWSRAHIGIVATGLVAGALNLAALTERDASVSVLVAVRSLQPGARLRPGDLSVTQVDARSPLLRTLLPAGDERADGWLVPHGLRAGEAVRLSDLRPPAWAQGRRAMSVPVEAEHAVGGALRAGDLVDVVGIAEGRASWVVLGAEVLDVPELDTGGLGAVTAYSVTIAITEAQALRLALALREGQVEVLRSTGAAAVSAPDAAVETTPSEAGDDA